MIYRLQRQMKLNESSMEEIKKALPGIREAGHGLDLLLSDTAYNREVPFKDLEDLYRYLSDEKIPTTCHLPYINLHPGSRDPEVHRYAKDSILEGLEMASVLHASIAVLHLGFCNHIPPKHQEGWKERVLALLREMIEQAEEEELILAIENTYEPDGEMIRSVLDEIDSPWLRFCADLGHAACFARMAPEEWISEFKDRIVLLNFHDNDGLDDLHNACGDGVVGYEPVFEACKEADLTCPIVLEVSEEAWEPSVAHLKEIGFEFGEVPAPTV
ncbi:MAG: TIM barrel protein [Candidatus Latescibacteria bacterium]|nr:TIM barrel protein [Candidatus Latescibacterota bacterium]